MPTNKVLACLAAAAAGCTGSAVSADVIGPGVISTDAVEYGAIIDPIDRSIYFVRSSAPWGESGRTTLMRSVLDEGGWSEPEIVFGDVASVADPFITVDGRWLYFTRTEESDGERTSSNIWRASRTPDGWSEAAPVAGVNSQSREFSPVLTADGALYFASERPGGFGSGDLWVALPSDDGFSEPKNLGPAVNSPTGEWNLAVSPDGTLLVFEASGRDTNVTVSGDLYLSRATPSGWSPPQPLTPLNTPGSDLMPRFSPDMTQLYFASTGTSESRDAQILAVPLSTLLSAAQRFVAVVARSAHEVALVDLETGLVVQRHATGEGPHEVAAAPDGSRIYVPAYGVYPTPPAASVSPRQLTWQEAEGGRFSTFDVASSVTVERRICPRSHGVTVTSNDGHIWVTCEESGEVLEFEPDQLRIVRRWATGGEGTHQLAANREGRFVAAANTESADVSIIDRATGQVRQVATGAGAEGLAMAPDGRQLWVGNAAAGTVSLVDLEEARLVETFSSGGRFPVKLAADPETGELWVVNTFSRTITIFDGATRDRLGKLEFETPPLGILISPDGTRVLLSFPRRHEIRVFDRARRSETARITGIIEADGMAWIASP